MAEKVDKVIQPKLKRRKPLPVMPGDMQIRDKEGNIINPNVLGTAPVYLSRSKPLKAINLYFPPGVGKFYVERLDKNHIRFLIRTDEIDRLIDKAEKIIKGDKAGEKND